MICKDRVIWSKGSRESDSVPPGPLEFNESGRPPVYTSPTLTGTGRVGTGRLSGVVRVTTDGRRTGAHGRVEVGDAGKVGSLSGREPPTCHSVPLSPRTLTGPIPRQGPTPPAESCLDGSGPDTFT